MHTIPLARAGPTSSVVAAKAAATRLAATSRPACTGCRIGSGRARGHADDGSVQSHAAERAREDRVTEGEYAAVRRNEPVAATVGGGGHPFHRCVHVRAAHGAEVGGI